MNKLISLCCVCEENNNREETKKLKEQGLDISHGYCDEHLKIQMEMLDRTDLILNKE